MKQVNSSDLVVDSKDEAVVENKEACSSREGQDENSKDSGLCSAS